MSNGIRLAGICCVTVALCVAILVTPDKPEIWGPLIAILAALLGVPLAVSVIQKKRGIITNFTWCEWHAMVSGWGDGVALNKSEKIPNVKEIPENPRDDDFYAIIAREAWYYKVGVALGRLTWALIIICLLIRLLR
ncbi:MAG: hypothetical protein ACUVTR_01910 [Dehalococcoidia bacterium]